MVMLIISAIVVWLYVISELMKKHGLPRRLRRGNGPIGNSRVPPALSVPHRFTSFQPTTLYHGTSLQSAFEIYKSGMWMVGNSKPSAVWMTDNFAVASSYIKGTGGIVIISVAPWLRLTQPTAGVFIYEIPYAQPWAEYYQIQGLKPVGVLDVNGNRLA